jgi:hypothetical protein
MSSFKQLQGEKMTTDKDIGEEMSDDFDECVRRGDYNRASLLMNKLWLDTQIFLTQKMNPELKEINYLKAPITIGSGTYLLSLLHVDGEKIKLQKAEGVDVTISADTKGAV